MTVDGKQEAAHAAVLVDPIQPPPVVVEHTTLDAQPPHATSGNAQFPQATTGGTIPHGALCVGVPASVPATMAPPIMIERRLVAKRLKPEGWLCACVLLFLFWPLACVPCCLDDCKDEIYEDVYVTPTVITNQGVYVTPQMIAHAPPPQHLG